MVSATQTFALAQVLRTPRFPTPLLECANLLPKANNASLTASVRLVFALMHMCAVDIKLVFPALAAANAHLHYTSISLSPLNAPTRTCAADTF